MKPLLTELGRPGKGLQPTVYRLAKKEGNIFCFIFPADQSITRGCASRDEMTTYRPKCQKDLNDPEVTHCYCPYDLCNAGSHLHADVWLPSLLLGIAMGKYF